MSNTNVTMPEATFRKLQEMAEWAGSSVEEALERAVNERYDRQFWDAVNAGYAALRAEPDSNIMNRQDARSAKEDQEMAEGI